MIRLLLSLLCAALVAGCRVDRARPYDFPTEVSTGDRPVQMQDKRTWAFPEVGLTFDNEFAAARVNALQRLGRDTFVVSVAPENEPVNPSPWYALRITADDARRVTLRLSYPAWARHRYRPKISTDRTNWTPVDTSLVRYGADSSWVDISLGLDAGSTYLAGQEIVSSADVRAWAEALLGPDVQLASAGQSKLGRDLPVLTVARGGQLRKRSTIVILSRQHPPEVTGYLAMQAFVERLLAHPERDVFLQNYQLLIFPILNPDGVDLGHWRHTAGGIDANRDWAYYRQPETRQVADYIVAAPGKVVIGLDFHSTWNDVYYTFREPAENEPVPNFKDAWLRGIEAGIGGGFRVNERAGEVGRPTSSGWFRTQFGAVGITYEIGDDTDRAFVRRKGQVSADALVEVLLGNDQ